MSTLFTPFAGNPQIREVILMGHGEVAGTKRRLEGAELENYLRIKKRLEEIWLEDGRLRDELKAMGLKFERKWWHGPSGKPVNFEV